MRGILYCVLLLTIGTGYSFNAFSQVNNFESFQKKILDSVRLELTKNGISNSLADSLKLLPGKFPAYLDQVFEAVNKTLEEAKSTGDINKLEGGYYKLSTLDSIRGNYKGAYENYKLFALYRDSLQKKEAEKKELEYEFARKQAIAKAEQDKKDAEAKRTKNIQYFTIAGLALLLLVIVLIAIIQWRNNKHKKAANALLQLQKDKVETAFTELKSTQEQLIHSEKMASLGELTAGIAHEIKNPLNFVNNFSELNKELVGELVDEIGTGNTDEIKLIAKRIEENSKKISQHGKRADAIVKGMLQHSQKSTGQKEPTDINALCDEYLRLAYHGLRAKDKSFNASIETDFDSSIGKVNVVPQDIGRVLLNLINNAFYAVSERWKVEGEGFKPLVEVTTKSLDGKVEIAVKDNGPGIAESIKEKIFQPFFTTKPTGQGTGLGLSLSYDIVKAHGGELKLETEEGKGSSFIIQLPGI